MAPFQKKTIASFVYGCFSRNLLIDEKRFEFHPNWKNVPLSSRVTGSVCWMKKGKKGEGKKKRMFDLPKGKDDDEDGD